MFTTIVIPKAVIKKDLATPMSGGKGISPIASTLLLIMVVVAATVTTYNLVIGLVGVTATSPLRSVIRVDEVSISGSELTVYVRNLGPAPMTLDSVYVYSVDGVLVGRVHINPKTIDAGEVEAITGIPIGYLKEGGVYYIKVATMEGAIASSQAFKVGLAKSAKAIIVIERLETEPATLNTFNATLYVKNAGDVPVTIDEVRVYYSLSKKTLLESIDIAKRLNPGETVRIVIDKIPYDIERQRPSYEIEVTTIEGVIATTKAMVLAREMLVETGLSAEGFNIDASIYVINYGAAPAIIDKVQVYIDGELDSIVNLGNLSLGVTSSTTINFNVTIDPSKSYSFKIVGSDEALTSWRAIVVAEASATPINDRSYSVTVYVRNVGSTPVTIYGLYIQSERGDLIVPLIDVGEVIKPKEIKEIINPITLTNGTYYIFVFTDEPWFLEAKTRLELV
ncbi:MAG: hypothetical protein QW701_03875 [Candidatus Nezhaarchaeales archaeon]